MKKAFISKITLAVVATLTLGMGNAYSTPIYAGSWRVDQGPAWGTAPTTYTGQEAAALLFGGVASDYYISTIDNLVADINRMAWSSIYAKSGGTAFADNYKKSSGHGQYRTTGDTSAYVTDNAIGAAFTNYAFRVNAQADPVTVPEPESIALLGLGLLGLAAARRKSVK